MSANSHMYCGSTFPCVHSYSISRLCTCPLSLLPSLMPLCSPSLMYTCPLFHIYLYKQTCTQSFSCLWSFSLSLPPCKACLPTPNLPLFPDVYLVAVLHMGAPSCSILLAHSFSQTHHVSLLHMSIYILGHSCTHYLTHAHFAVSQASVPVCLLLLFPSSEPPPTSLSLTALLFSILSPYNASSIKKNSGRLAVQKESPM